MRGEAILRVVLTLIGLSLAAVGTNTALGGMATLGWQFPPEAVAAVDPEGVARHDSNARVFAGVFVGLGLVVAAAGPWLPAAGPAAALLAVALGGVARLLQPGYAPLADPALRASVAAELVLMPLLASWTLRARR